MPREDSLKICCVCLGSTLKLNQLSVTDGNKLTLHTKLKICISEIEWWASYLICEQCIRLLDISYTFRETCLKSELVRQKKVDEKLNSDLVKYEIQQEEFQKFADKANLTEGRGLDIGGVKDETINDDTCEAILEDEPDYVDPTNLEYKSESDQYKHQKWKKRKNVQFTCEQCDNIYNSSEHLVEHCIKDHGMRKLDIKPFSCERCPSRFCNSSNLLQHVKCHDAVGSIIMCTYCGKEFTTKKSLKIHEKRHLNRREYKCNECEKCFNTHKDSSTHKLVVHTDPICWKYCCEICQKMFPIKSNYDSHMRRHLGDKKFECHLCQKKFTDKCVLQKHMRSHTNVREHKCAHCDREYKDPRILKEWWASYLICEQCIKLLDISYTFRETCLKSELVRQKKIDKKSNSDLVKYEAEQEELRKVADKAKLTEKQGLDIGGVKDETTDDDTCEPNSEDEPDYVETTNLEYKSESAPYKRQKRKKRKNVQFTCEQCDNIYNSSKKFVEHCIKDHGMRKLDIKPFSCERCPSRFCNSSNLLQHVKYHDAVRSNMCTYCGKGFITKTDLNIHEKQHLNRREYKCNECEKCFNTHKDIRSHKLVVHTDPICWKYCCEICHKMFPIKSNYDSHMRRHTGDKKFECHLCQKKFTDKCVLQRHMRTHTNVREHKCTHCDREYKDPGVLKVHKAKIHGIGLGQIKLPSKEKKYICHICPKSYYAKNKLTRHLYTHSGEKPYDCPVCGKKFNDKSYVKQHLKKTHSMDEAPQENNDTVNMNGMDQDVLCGAERYIKFEG